MSVLSPLSSSNTFTQWLAATSELISITNSLTDGGNTATFYANTNLEIGNTSNFIVSGNLTVTGNVTLESAGFDDMLVNGSIYIANTISVTGTSTLTGNTSTGNLSITGAGTVTGNLTVSANTTTANLSVSGTTIFATANITTANVTSLDGAANTAIYAAIATIGQGTDPSIFVIFS